jgi:hypothetical protein
MSDMRQAIERREKGREKKERKKQSWLMREFDK